MATIAENLVALNEAKANIKSAIESKGQDLTGVPFTQYADKINAISAGGSGDDTLKGLIDGSVTEVNIPSGTTKIRDYAFYKCASLSSCEIPNTITTLGIYAFSECSSLVNVHFDNSCPLVRIQNYAFSKCSKLQNINLPSTVQAIGTYAFSSCSDLKNIILPESLKTIESYGFNSAGITEITIPDSVTSLGSNNTFSTCSSLTSVNIGKGVTIIPSTCFNTCSKLESINIPDNITTINQSAFHGCSLLSNVTIGKGIKTIGSSVFNYCSKLTKVIFSAELTAVPTLANTNAFSSTSADLKIYVPDALYDTWIASTNWSSIASKIAKLSEMPAE